MSEAGSGPRATAGSSSTPLSRREQMLRYLLNHPEYDEPQTSGELTFFIAKQATTGKPVVVARFNAHLDISR